MKLLPELPAYSDDALAALDLPQIIASMIRDEDRVPRNVIDECARRGDAAVEQLAQLLDDKRSWQAKDTTGEWWLLQSMGSDTITFTKKRLTQPNFTMRGRKIYSKTGAIGGPGIAPPSAGTAAET